MPIPADAKARERLGYDEVFANQLAMTLVRADTRKRRGRALNGDGRLRDMLKLPYTLTGAQSRTVREIEGDLAQDAPMLRLLQGDVGAGKTLVAAMAMLIAVEAGGAGGDAGSDRNPRSPALRDASQDARGVAARDRGADRPRQGQGAGSHSDGAGGGRDRHSGRDHAIFQETVTYRDLALVVVDEQHRFGVAQRMMLSAKGKAPPHLLAMTATPIPRTLTLANYGEMDVSRLDEMPPGRQPIETRVVSEDRLDEVVNALGRHLSDGGQAYWVCPLVEESEKSDLAAARCVPKPARPVRRAGRPGSRQDEARREGRGDGGVRGRAVWACWSRRR